MKRSAGNGAGNRPTVLLKFVLLVILALAALALLSYIVKTNQQMIRLRTISGPIVNPLMGWAPWATIRESQQRHTLVYADLTWREFEPEEGYYDFDRFEKKEQLAFWRKEGQRVVFRFVLDAPSSQSHLDIPDWLFEKIDGSGDYYDNEYGKGFSPDYSNQVLIASHREAIRALGERYGKDGFFAFIEIGSLGHWGEWHTHSELPPLPPENIRNLYVAHYMEAFPGIHLLMRRPFSIAQRLELGLYNDMTADPVQTDKWLSWIRYGGEYPPGEEHSLLPMPSAWKRSPIGGEQSPSLSNDKVYGSGLEQTLQLLKASHTTFIGPNGPDEVASGGPLQDGVDRVLTTIGYRIYLDQAQMPQWVLHGRSLRITLTFSNAGIAPIYYNWPSQLYLFDGKGNVAMTYRPEVDLRSVLPGEFYEVAINMPLGNLENGSYSLGIAIIDPMTGQPGVRLANENTRQDLIQYIGSFEVRELLDLLHF